MGCIRITVIDDDISVSPVAQVAYYSTRFKQPQNGIPKRNSFGLCVIAPALHAEELGSILAHSHLFMNKIG